MNTGASNTSSAYYLYAIVPLSASEQVKACLVDGLKLICGETYAVVARPCESAIPPKDDREKLARLLIAHQQVIQTIRELTPVLPVKFGCVAPDLNSLKHCLISGETKFAKAFLQFSEKSQYEIIVTWELDAIFAEIAQSEEIMQQKNAGVSALELGGTVKKLLDEKRSKLASKLSSALCAVSADAVGNLLLNDSMVLNLAVLIDDYETDALDVCLEELDEAHDGNLNFRCVGPLPPYSFASVEVDFFDHGKVSWARNILGVDENAYPGDVKAAYHKLAKEMHPDLKSSSSDETDMSALQDAYETICALNEAGGPAQVSVRRQEIRTD